GRHPTALDHIALEPDVLVVGGGPAGLAAAAGAAEAGADVLLLDERAKLGGQYFKQPSAAFAEAALDAQYRRGRELIGRVLAAGVTVEPGTQVWAASGPALLYALGETRALVIRPPRPLTPRRPYHRAVPLPP